MDCSMRGISIRKREGFFSYTFVGSQVIGTKCWFGLMLVLVLLFGTQLTQLSVVALELPE